MHISWPHYGNSRRRRHKIQLLADSLTLYVVDEVEEEEDQ